MVAAASSPPADADADAADGRPEATPFSSVVETSSMRAAAVTTPTAADEPTEVARTAVETAATGDNDDARTGEGAVRSPSKRPRISGKDDADDANNTPVPPSRDNDDDVIDMTSSVTPMPSTEVIDISSSEPSTSSSQSNSGNAVVRIKTDPNAAKSPTKKRKMTTEDSDVEILSPGRFPKPSNSSAANTSVDAGINDMHADEVEVTASTTTNANIAFAHLRHQCGVHPFSVITTSVSSNDANGLYCSKCYCFVCDVLASECKHWKEGGGGDAHCHAHDKDDKWATLREETLRSKPKSPVAPPRNPYQNDRNNQSNRGNQGQAQGMHQQVTSLIHNEFLSRLATGNSDPKSSGEEQRRQRARERKEMRIPEVLWENFQRSISLRENSMEEERGNGARADSTSKENSLPPLHQKMEGDIPTLTLHNSFFVQGVKIGWPFPEIMKPQRQMAIHLIKALKGRNHVVLESPTGTGKSAAILCSVLAWQRHHMKMERMKRQSGDSPTRDGGNVEGGGNEGGKAQKVKVIYCSRTHSQVAQMVASLKSTPYRPRMAILGSRDRLCIHRSIRPRGQGAEPVTGVNVNNECRLRVRNTEKSRKQQLSNPNYRSGPYNDDDPPEVMPGDGGDRDGIDNDADEDRDDNNYISRSRTCPHYRQLTTSRVANLAHSTFVPNKQVDCCSVGGKKSKYGAHDIEDLVNFGVDPYLQRDVALYRRKDEKGKLESFGLSMKDGGGRGGGAFVRAVKPNTPAEINGNVKAGDKIVRVNGCDVSRSNTEAVVHRVKQTGSDPLLLDVSRGGAGSLSSDGGYSSRGACPYYISQILSKDADIIFAPYNYILDPGIREALDIELDNSVVILDEAHNVESTLREAGSGKFGEFELCELIVMLNENAVTERSTNNMMDVGGDASLLGSETETAYLCDVAHTLLLFVEKVIMKLRTARTCFQNNPGSRGAVMALREWEKYHTADDKEFEVTFDGPTGKGHQGKCVGCLPFFDKLGLSKSDLDGLCTYVDAFEKFFRGREGSDGPTERDRISTLVDRLTELVYKLNAAIKTPEHYYAAVVAMANGSLEFANGGDCEAERGGRSWKKKPRALPLVSPKTTANPDRPANPCVNPFCRAKITDAFNPIRHGSYCDGSTPKWECHLHLSLLTPGPLMQELSNSCRTVVLASGSLSPIPSLCAELNLFSTDTPLSPARSSKSPDPSDPGLPKIQKRLQNKPGPLEADHVVDLEKQLFACSIGHFPDGSELRVSQKNYKQPDFLPKLGDALVRIVAGIPHGGVLVFLPSYALLRKCERSWNPNGFRQNNRGWWARNDDFNDGNPVWDRLTDLKHKVIVEPSGGQDEFEEKKQEYMDSVKTNGGCVLLAVYRGKMSEGISFNDNNARGVICVGLPLPSAFALDIKVKMDYNDEQRTMRKRTDLLPGREWYNQQAYRAIAQALGRCIRHAADYGAIFLLDVRHCDDGSPNDGIPQAHAKLPKWMRRSVKNLSRQSKGRSSMFNYVSSSSVSGGWPELKSALQRFFRIAKPHANGVLKKHKEKTAAAGKSAVVHTFNVRTNQWSEKSTPPPSLLSSSPCQSNESSNSISTTLKKAGLSTSAETNACSSGNGSLYFIDRQPSKSGQASAKKKGTLQEMFKKQEETEGTQKRSAPSSSKATRRATLKTMFEKQRACLSPLPPTQETSDAEKEETTESPASSIGPPSATKSGSESIAQESSPPSNSFTFTRSPFANDMLSPTTEVAAGTSQLVLSQGRGEVAADTSQLASSRGRGQSQASSTAEEEERLCVVCEDGKKEVLLLPCKHMCLCKNCASTCLFKTIKECPMCRATVTDSMDVFW